MPKMTHLLSSFLYIHVIVLDYALGKSIYSNDVLTLKPRPSRREVNNLNECALDLFIYFHECLSLDGCFVSLAVCPAALAGRERC